MMGIEPAFLYLPTSQLVTMPTALPKLNFKAFSYVIDKNQLTGNNLAHNSCIVLIS